MLSSLCGYCLPSCQAERQAPGLLVIFILVTIFTVPPVISVTSFTFIPPTHPSTQRWLIACIISCTMMLNNRMPPRRIKGNRLFSLATWSLLLLFWLVGHNKTHASTPLMFSNITVWLCIYVAFCSMFCNLKNFAPSGSQDSALNKLTSKTTIRSPSRYIKGYTSIYIFWGNDQSLTKYPLITRFRLHRLNCAPGITTKNVLSQDLTGEPKTDPGKNRKGGGRHANPL